MRRKILEKLMVAGTAAIFLAIVICLLWRLGYGSRFIAHADDISLLNDTFEKQIISRYVNAINSGNMEIAYAFVRREFDAGLLSRPKSTVQSSFMAPYYASGGLGYEFHAPQPAGPGFVSALVRNRLTGVLIKWTVCLTETKPQKIADFVQLEPLGPSSNLPYRPRIKRSQLIRKLDIALNKMADDEEFSGVVMVVKSGQPLYSKAFGLASRSYKVKNTVDTQFNIASVGKIFTSVAIAQLVEEGRLSYEESIERYVSPDWLSPEIATRIKIKHLLTHTSGLGDYFSKIKGQITPLFFRELVDYTTLVKNESLTFEPGTQFAYSNTGFLLLGIIVERVSGERFWEYLKKHIFTPAGMSQTQALEKDLAATGRSVGYSKEINSDQILWRENSATRILKGSPSGGVYSTAGDLLKFSNAIQTHRLLSKPLWESLVNPLPEIGAPYHGLAFFTYTGTAGRIAAHGGDGMGINCQFKIYLDSNYTVIVLANHDAPAADTVDSLIEQMIACASDSIR